MALGSVVSDVDGSHPLLLQLVDAGEERAALVVEVDVVPSRVRVVVEQRPDRRRGDSPPVVLLWHSDRVESAVAVVPAFMAIRSMFSCASRMRAEGPDRLPYSRVSRIGGATMLDINVDPDLDRGSGYHRDRWRRYSRRPGRPVAPWFARTLGVIYFTSGVVFGLTTLWIDFSVIPGGESAILASASGAASVGAVQFFRAAKSTNLSVADLVLYLGILVPVGAAVFATRLPEAAPRSSPWLLHTRLRSSLV